MSDHFEPKIVGFLCNWCSYAGADLAGTSRLSYAPNIRIVRVPCTGRVDPLFVARALKDGADGVLVLGCHPGDCHYSDGNYVARRRFAIMQELLYFLGYERPRVRLDWVSASEGARFARVVNDFTAQVAELGPRRVDAAVDIAPVELPAAYPPDLDFAGLTEAWRKLARQLVASGEVAQVLGWERGSIRVRPLFARTEAQAARLVVDASAGLNLVTYLRYQRGQRTAVLLRPAEMRSLRVLLQEGQLAREDIYVVALDAAAADVDAVLGGVDTPLTPSATHPLLDDMESWPVGQRAAFWNAQFERCLRCYACRQACPLCYCSECVSEQVDPAWQSIAIDTDEKAFFHVLRAFHLAGRCTGCDACAAACPAGIPLFLLNQKVAREAKRLFDGYGAGSVEGAPLLFTTFRREESLRPAATEVTR